MTRDKEYQFLSETACEVFNTNQPSLPTLFYSVLVSVSVLMVLSTVFSSINSPSVLLVLFCLIGPFHYMSFNESLPQP